MAKAKTASKKASTTGKTSGKKATGGKSKATKSEKNPSPIKVQTPHGTLENRTAVAVKPSVPNAEGNASSEDFQTYGGNQATPLEDRENGGRLQ